METKPTAEAKADRSRPNETKGVNVEQKICTYCGQEGHRASTCPHLRAAEACTELGSDYDNKPLFPSWLIALLLVCCLIGVVLHLDLNGRV